MTDDMQMPLGEFMALMREVGSGAPQRVGMAATKMEQFLVARGFKVIHRNDVLTQKEMWKTIVVCEEVTGRFETPAEMEMLNAKLALAIGYTILRWVKAEELPTPEVGKVTRRAVFKFLDPDPIPF